MTEYEILEFLELICERLEEIRTEDKNLNVLLDRAYSAIGDVIEQINKNEAVDSETVKSVNT